VGGGGVRRKEVNGAARESREGNRRNR